MFTLSFQLPELPDFSFVKGWLKDGNVERTLRTIGNMALMVSEWIRTFTIKKETIFGIGILNEPGGQFDQIWTKIMEDFYPKAYQTLRLIDPEGDKQG